MQITKSRSRPVTLAEHQLKSERGAEKKGRKKRGGMSRLVELVLASRLRKSDLPCSLCFSKKKYQDQPEITRMITLHSVDKITIDGSRGSYDSLKKVCTALGCPVAGEEMARRYIFFSNPNAVDKSVAVTYREKRAKIKRFNKTRENLSVFRELVAERNIQSNRSRKKKMSNK